MKYQNKFFFPEYQFTVAESDTVNIPQVQGDGVLLVCTTAGTAVVTDKGGTTVTWTLEVGDYVPVRAFRLGTTSTGTFIGLR